MSGVNNLFTVEVARKPTPAELADLQEYVAAITEYFPGEEEYEMARDAIANAYISVFDNYADDDGRYSGKIMMVVWNIGVAFYELFCWREGKFTRVMQEADLADEHSGWLYQM